MAYGNFKNLPRRTALDKVLADIAFNIAKNLNYDEYHGELASMAFKIFNEKLSGANISVGAIKKEIMPNQQLSEELL